MRRLLILSGLIVAAGCAKGPALPDQPSDDPSTRTTTLVNPVSTPQEMAEKCDVPMYPGAKAPDGMSRMPRKDADGTHYDLVLTTSSPTKDVARFYSDKLKIDPKPSDGGVTFVGTTPHRNDLLLTVNSEGGQTLIRIKAIVPSSK